MIGSPWRSAPVSQAGTSKRVPSLTRPVDAVVHSASLVDDWGTYEPFRRDNVDGTRHVLATWPEARIVHVSSASVSTRAQIRRACAGRCRSVRRRARAGELAQRLRTHQREAENLVMARAFDRSIILRPPPCTAPATTLLPRLLRRFRFGRLMVGAPGDRLSLTHVDNFAWAVELAIESDATGAFNIATRPPRPAGAAHHRTATCGAAGADLLHPR